MGFKYDVPDVEQSKADYEKVMRGMDKKGEIPNIEEDSQIIEEREKRLKALADKKADADLAQNILLTDFYDMGILKNKEVLYYENCEIYLGSSHRYLKKLNGIIYIYNPISRIFELLSAKPSVRIKQLKAVFYNKIVFYLNEWECVTLGPEAHETNSSKEKTKRVFKCLQDKVVRNTNLYCGGMSSDAPYVIPLLDGTAMTSDPCVLVDSATTINCNSQALARKVYKLNEMFSEVPDPIKEQLVNSCLKNRSDNGINADDNESEIDEAYNFYFRNITPEDEVTHQVNVTQWMYKDNVRFMESHNHPELSYIAFVKSIANGKNKLFNQTKLLLRALTVNRYTENKSLFVLVGDNPEVVELYIRPLLSLVHDDYYCEIDVADLAKDSLYNDLCTKKCVFLRNNTKNLATKNLKKASHNLQSFVVDKNPFYVYKKNVRNRSVFIYHLSSEDYKENKLGLDFDKKTIEVIEIPSNIEELYQDEDTLSFFVRYRAFILNLLVTKEPFVSDGTDVHQEEDIIESMDAVGAVNKFWNEKIEITGCYEDTLGKEELFDLLQDYCQQESYPFDYEDYMDFGRKFVSKQNGYMGKKYCTVNDFKNGNFVFGTIKVPTALKDKYKDLNRIWAGIKLK